ncbi:hypothetical protein OAT18_00010 [Tenacibaculum sp.]|nr:hypothetical protein [Tenacibaculum sp.]
MVTEELIKNQRDEASQVDAKYTVIASGAGVTCNEKPILEALLPGVRLHFLRYGLFPKKGEGRPNAMRIKDHKDEEFTLSDADASNGDLQTTDRFMVGATLPREGYIYLINPDDDKDCHELKVNPDGNMSHVIWDNENFYNHNNELKDKRTPENDNIYYKRIINKEKENARSFWIGYSPVQWSYKQFKKVLDMDDEKRKVLHMVLVKAEGIKKGKETAQKHILPYTKIEFVYHKEDHLHGAFKERLKKISDVEKKESNDILEDMFVTLHDPVGCALDISNVVDDKTTRFKAFIDTIQSGESIKDAVDRIASGNLEVPRPKNKECEELFTLALTCYQLVYNDDKAILKYDGGSPGWFNFSDRHYLDPRPMHKMNYNNRAGIGRKQKNVEHIGYGLDSEKLEGILGIKERNTARKELINYRDDLGEIANSDYLKQHLDNYLDNHLERVLEGRNILLHIIDPLSYHPYKFDQHLMLREEFVKEDKWVNWVYQVIDDNPSQELKSKKVKSESEDFSGLDPMLALLGAPLNMNEFLSKAESISQKLAGVYKKNLKFRGSQAADLKEIDGTLYKGSKQKFVVAKLNKNLKVYGKEMFEIVDGDIWMKLEKLGVKLDPEHIKQGRYTGKREDILRILKESHGKEGFTYRTLKRKSGNVYQVTAKVVEDKSGDLAAAKNFKISKIINGRAFNGVFAALELYNFGNALIKVTSEGSTVKDFVYSLGSAVKLTEASANLGKAFILASGKDVSAVFAKRLTGLSVAGGVITAGWCFYDSYKAMDKGDMDAGFAMIGAGVAFGVAAAASLGTVAILGGPVGWIAALVGVGFIIVASLLTDTELETYFKNFLLSDTYTKGFPKPTNMSPIEYMQKVLDKREELTDEDYHDTLMNPFDAQAKLFDYIVCKEISFTPINSKTNIYTNYNIHSSGISTIETASYFSAKMVFSRFFNHPNQIETHAIFYPKGIRNGEGIPMKIGTTCKIYDSEQSEALEVKFWVPNEHVSKITLQSDVLFALRLKIDESQKIYFPYSLQNKERYLGAKIKLKDLGTGFFISDLKQDKDVTIDTLENLKTTKPW